MYILHSSVDEGLELVLLPSPSQLLQLLKVTFGRIDSYSRIDLFDFLVHVK